MDLTVITYLVYLALAIPLTVWVARALTRHGQVFLNVVFNGDADLARAVNQLLVIGFYLVNLGYVALFMKSNAAVGSARQLMEVLSAKVGAVAIVIGVVHFANVFAFNAFRRRAVVRALAEGPNPLQPPPAGTAAWAGPAGTAVPWAPPAR